MDAKLIWSTIRSSKLKIQFEGSDYMTKKLENITARSIFLPEINISLKSGNL
jgi:hypothetical protein